MRKETGVASMDIRKCITLLALALVTLLAFCSSAVEACSCSPEHPQTHFCKDNYVIVVRVLRKSHRLVPHRVAYKVEIKKPYKITPEAQKLLKNGILTTASTDSMCGVNLEIGKLYVISANTEHIGICNYVKEYLKMSVIERRGFAGVYRKGCKCHIKTCFTNNCEAHHDIAKTCKWSPFTKCETDFSACMPSSFRTPEGTISKCRWRRTPAYKACMRDP